MALCPFAEHRLMPYNSRLPKRKPARLLVVHTNGGGTDHGSLYGWFSRSGNTICSHFQVMLDGTIEQYVDTDRQAYAQWDANDRAVSVETQDDGHPDRKWTPAQVKALVKLARWLDVPAKVALDHKGGGIGWHSLYADWNQSGHNCPGSVRVKQIHDEILPALAGSTGPRPKAEHPHPSHTDYPVLRKGMRSDAVKYAQKLLGFPARKIDGIYGRETENAVRSFQRSEHLEPDGICGPRTWAALTR